MNEEDYEDADAGMVFVICTNFAYYQKNERNSFIELAYYLNFTRSLQRTIQEFSLYLRFANLINATWVHRTIQEPGSSSPQRQRHVVGKDKKRHSSKSAEEIVQENWKMPVEVESMEPLTPNTPSKSATQRLFRALFIHCLFIFIFTGFPLSNSSS